jgi:hypothetical protein
MPWTSVSLTPGMEVDSKRSGSEFDAGYCGKLLDKTWDAGASFSQRRI